MAVQSELQTTTQCDPIDEGEGGYPRRIQLVEDRMSALGNCQGLVVVDDLGKPGEVGARCQDEWLASNCDRQDLLACERGIQRAIQFPETAWAQGCVRAVVRCPA